jgi:ribonuclease-3
MSDSHHSVYSLFKDIQLLELALTHPSVNKDSAENYERLEFLGDRVLALAISTMLYKKYPLDSEGTMAKKLSFLVRKESLYKVAKNLDLGSILIMSANEESNGGRSNKSALANACEALLGAIYLENGFEKACDFIEENWQKLILKSETRSLIDPKSELQEWAQGLGFPIPVYEMLHSYGPQHSLNFEMKVSVNGYSATGKGNSKQTAEKEAAKKLLLQVKKEEE